MNQIVKRDAVEAFKTQVANRESEFKMALPAHIPVERFIRVVNTAVAGNPDLLNADRVSLFQSAMKAAQDGLLPDSRDGALVIYGRAVQWMPMIGGILKKIRNSGELLSISAYVAYSNDEFTYELGDEEKITHRPALEDRGRPRLVYAVAKTKDGGIYREVMTVAEVEKVRNVSRAKNTGPWRDWWDEMAKKTVLRRLAKRLPMSSDLDDILRRDDDLYDFAGAKDAAKSGPVVNGLAGRLDAIAGTSRVDAETGEIIDQENIETGVPDAPQEAGDAAGDAGSTDASGSLAADNGAEDVTFPSSAPESDYIFEEGRAAAAAGKSRNNAPLNIRKDDALLSRWLAGYDAAVNG